MNVFNWTSAVVLSIVLASSSLAAPTSQPAVVGVATVSRDDQAVEKLLDHKLPRVALPGNKLSDSIDFIRDITGANIYIDWTALELAGVGKDTQTQADLVDTPIRHVFKRILDNTGSHALDIEVAYGTIIVSTKLNIEDRKKQIGPYLPELSDPMAATVLDKRIAQVSMPQVSIANMVDFLNDISGAYIIVKWKVLERAGIEKNALVDLSLRKLPLSAVLYFVLDQVGAGKLGYAVSQGQKPTWDNAIKKFVPRPGAVITISTVDDLIANKGYPATQPN